MKVAKKYSIINPKMKNRQEVIGNIHVRHESGYCIMNFYIRRGHNIEQQKEMLSLLQDVILALNNNGLKAVVRNGK